MTTDQATLLARAESLFSRGMTDDILFDILDDMARITAVRLAAECSGCGGPVDMTGRVEGFMCIPCRNDFLRRNRGS